MGAGRRIVKYNPDVHHRKNIRLQEYDYSKEGMYYITICVQNRECILGKIANDVININHVKKCRGRRPRRP